MTEKKSWLYLGECGRATHRAMDDILDVDLLAFEQGTAAQTARSRRRCSPQPGHRVRVHASRPVRGPARQRLRRCCAEFFSLPQDVKQGFVAPESHGQTGYTGLLVETAASSDVPDWKEMLNWGRELPPGIRCGTVTRIATARRCCRRRRFPARSKLLTLFHDRIEDLQRRFLRVIAEAIGCHESLFDEMTHNGATLTRAIRYPPMTESPGGTHVWAGCARRHQPHHRAAALDCARAAGARSATTGSTRSRRKARSSSTPG